MSIAFQENRDEGMDQGISSCYKREQEKEVLGEAWESESFKPCRRGEVPSNELVSGQDQEEGTGERELEMQSESKSIVLCKCFTSSLSSQKGRLIICTIVLLISRAWENKSDV